MAQAIDGPARTMGNPRSERTRLLARCRASRRRSVDGADSSHSTPAVGATLHAPFETFVPLKQKVGTIFYTANNLR